MDYSLAKKLKDAGFPQRWYTGREFYYDSDHSSQVWVEDNDPTPVEGTVVIPTLSELIEACGDEFGNLNRIENQNWIVFTSHMESDSKGYRGSTPEEAVANLYLVLHAKKN